MQKKKKNTKEICQKLIDTHQDRSKSKNEPNLTEAQKKFYKAANDLVRLGRSPFFRYRDIKSKYKGGLLPSDFCYNLVNIAPDSEVKFLYCHGRGKYEFVNFNWANANSIKITWLPNGSDKLKKRNFTVGHYRRGKYEWNFKELAEFL